MATGTMPVLYVTTIITMHQGTAESAGATIHDRVRRLPLIGGQLVAVLLHQR